MEHGVSPGGSGVGLQDMEKLNDSMDESEDSDMDETVWHSKQLDPEDQKVGKAEVRNILEYPKILRDFKYLEHTRIYL